MAKVSIELSKKVDKKGLFPIKIIIRAGYSNTSVATQVSVNAENFIGDPYKVVTPDCPNAFNINTKVTSLYSRIADVIMRAEMDNEIDVLNNALEIKNRAFPEKRQEETKNKNNIIKYAMAYERECRSVKTAETYRMAIAKLKKFFGSEEIYFEDLTFKTITEFDAQMERDGLSDSSRGIVMRNIRTLFNKAINEEIIPLSAYPFRNFKIKKGHKEKEFLPVEYLRKLKDLPLKEGSELCRARDFFMLSFYFCGINPTDLYTLKKRDGYIKYERQKVSWRGLGSVMVKIQPEAQAIIDKYPGEDDWLLSFPTHFKDYKIFYQNHRIAIKELAKKIGYEEMTLYFARYSWATYALNYCDVPEFTIQKALGHEPSSTAAKHYIAFDWSKVDAANRKVIDYLLKK